MTRTAPQFAQTQPFSNLCIILPVLMRRNAPIRATVRVFQRVYLAGEFSESHLDGCGYAWQIEMFGNNEGVMSRLVVKP